MRPLLREYARKARWKGADVRAYIAHLRAVYRDSIRAERMFYWVDRHMAKQSPNSIMTIIHDGATQE